MLEYIIMFITSTTCCFFATKCKKNKIFKKNKLYKILLKLFGSIAEIVG